MKKRATEAQHAKAIPIITAAKYELSRGEFDDACREAGYADGVAPWQVVESRLPCNSYTKTHHLSRHRYRALIESLRRALERARLRQPRLPL